MRTLFSTLLLTGALVSGAAADPIPASPTPGLADCPSGLRGQNIAARNHVRLGHPSETDEFLVRLKAIRKEGLRLQTKDGGALTPADGAMLQGEIDTAYRQHTVYACAVAHGSFTGAERWGAYPAR